MRLVVVESPYAGDVEGNVAYATRCVRDCLMRGEAPIASHLMYPREGILNDAINAERVMGMAAGLAWGARADATVVYVDRGVSGGMLEGINHAFAHGRRIEWRALDSDVSTSLAVINEARKRSGILSTLEVLFDG